jgi:hypothetical protein
VTFPAFQLKVDDITYWAERYLEYDKGADDKAFEAARRIHGGDWSRPNLEVIVAWKSRRRIRLIADNSDSEIADALRLALIANEPRSAFGVLMGLTGVAVPMASAILTAIDQWKGGDKYTIIDYRALEALSVPEADYYNLNFYLHHYFPACKRMAREKDVTLRRFDRALWAWSEAEGKKSDIG